nr:metalloregulator ArsR/SmtB family transcription factor [Caldalkalibacillus salinus]
MAKRFKALGDPTRLKMVALLNHRDFCICELVPIFQISQPAISKHMHRLKETGLVREERRRQWVFYSLNRDVLHDTTQFLHDLPDMTQAIQALNENGMLVCQEDVD